jgi:hypothetical protein
MNYEKLNLRDNPFSATPSTGRPIWCGMPALKMDLEKRLSIALKTSPSALTINWGHYGSGKTHAAKYFTSPETIEQLGQAAGVADHLPLALYVSFPRVEKGAIFNITSSIIGRFGVADFAAKIRSVKTSAEATSQGLFAKLLNEYCQDSELQKLFLALVASEDANYDKLGRVLFGNSSAADLRDLQISRKPDSVSDLCRIVTTAFNLFTYRAANLRPLHSAIYLWIDEFEDIASLSGKEQDALASYLRNLMDWSPRYLSVLLNFTLTPVQQLQDLGLYLGDAVMSRIRSRIEFKEPDRAGIETYVREMLNSPGFRVTDAQTGQELAPFNPGALTLLLGQIDPPTPRRINEVFSFFLDLLAGMNGQTVITEQIVRDYAGEINVTLPG